MANEEISIRYDRQTDRQTDSTTLFSLMSLKIVRIGLNHVQKNLQNIQEKSTQRYKHEHKTQFSNLLA